MKQCPHDQLIFDDKVDFCFACGTPLVSIDDSSDPTSLPDPAEVKAADAPASDTTDVTPKPKRSKRGMFGRPSVADMLSVPVPTKVPPVGGNRVTPDTSTVPEDKPKSVPSTQSEAPPVQVPQARSTPVNEGRTVVEAVVELPDGSDLGTAETATPVAGAQAPLSTPVPSIEVPVSPAAVELPETEPERQESTEAPPGFEPEETALDDSWFTDGIEETDASELTQPIPAQPVEDPGFADTGESPVAANDVGFDDVGFDDSSWSAGGSTSSAEPIPKKMVYGGIAVLVACIALTALLSGDDTPPVERAVVAAPKPVPTPPPPVEPPVEKPAVEEAPPEEAAEQVPAEEVPAEEPPVEDPEPEVEPAAPVPVPVPPPPPPEPASKPAAAAPEVDRTPPPAAAAKPKETIPSPWTGAPAAAPAAAPAPAAASNPWGAPTETPSRGRLTITTEPAGAMVFVDNRRIGKSPTRTEVDYGTHNIRVELQDYKGASRVVNVRASEVSVPFRLETSRLVGKCMLLSPSGAQVAMNGRSIGTIPVAVACEPGTHSFKVTPPDGAGFTTSRSVSFGAPNETANLFLTP